LGGKKITLAQAIQAIFQSHAVADPSEEERSTSDEEGAKMLKCHCRMRSGVRLIPIHKRILLKKKNRALQKSLKQ